MNDVTTGYASRTAIEGLLTEFCVTPGSNVEIPVKIIPMITELLISALVKIERIDHTYKVQPTKDAEPYMVTDSMFKLITITGKNITDPDDDPKYPHSLRTTGIAGLMVRIFDIVGPMVGAPVTTWCHTDRHPGTIVKVSPSGKTIWVADDEWTRTDRNGQSESQEYTYRRDLEAAKVPTEFHLGRGKKNAGRWCCDGYRAAVGHRRKYEDPSF